MKTYEVVCEGVVQRLVLVEATNSVEAAQLAREEFSAFTGAGVEGVAVVDIYSEPVKFKEVKNEG